MENFTCSPEEVSVLETSTSSARISEYKGHKPADQMDLVLVNQLFDQSLLDDDDVFIEHYINGYNELAKFLNLIGSIFSFVSSDVKSKIKITEEHAKSDNAQHYVSCKKMMNFERDTGLVKKNGFVSGSRTLLRLHRGLDFIRLFLKRLGESDDDANTCTVCQNVYSDSLAQFHPWYIRKTAMLAMHALPARQELLEKVFGNETALLEALDILPKTLETLDKVYDRIESLYTEFEFHELP